VGEATEEDHGNLMQDNVLAKTQTGHPMNTSQKHHHLLSTCI
jgi:hypothetical protein